METLPLTSGQAGNTYSTEAKQNTSSKENASNEDESAFICNVCLEITNKDPVVTQCGHLYCWPCLYRWLNTNHTTCPVCKAGVTRDNVIPLFIRGSEVDPRSKTPRGGESVPNRPTGHRPEPQNFPTQSNPGGNLQYGVVTFSAGFGFFPSLFGLQFQSFPSLHRNAAQPLTEEELQQLHLSRALLVLGSLVLFGLLIF